MITKRLLAVILLLVLIPSMVFPLAYAVDGGDEAVEEDIYNEHAYNDDAEEYCEEYYEDGDEVYAEEASGATKTPINTKAAVTYDDVTRIVEEYYAAVKNKYWNADKSYADMKKLAYEDTVKPSGCPASTNPKLEHKRKTGCKSNLFKGVGSVDNDGKFDNTALDAQCSGFAAYMEWVIFHTTDVKKFKLCYGTGENSLKNLANDEIKPGDQLRYNGHSYVIYKVTSSKAYVIQCNTDKKDCKIWIKTDVPLSTIRNNIKKCDGKKSGYFSSPAIKTDTFTLRSYENHSGKNYLVGTDFESSLYSSCWSVRGEDGNSPVHSFSVDSTVKHNGYNSLRIVNSSPGASKNDLSIKTLTQGNVEKNGFVGDNKNMVLSFWAKSSSNGTKMYFRYGYEENYRSVTLSTDWKRYTVRMDKTKDYNTYIYSYIDRKGTVWLAEVQLEDGTTATEFIPEDSGEYKQTTEKHGKTYSLPPAPTWEGHTFLGWFTSASGGTEITSSTKVKDGNFCVYAHWDSYNGGISQELANPDYVLPSGLTEIREEAFVGIRVERIKLPAGIKAIGSRAFADSGSLNLIIIPAASVSIAENAFAGSGKVRIAAPAGGSVEAYANRKGIGFIATS